MRVLVTADTHIHSHKNNNQRLIDGVNVLEWVYETAIERECDEVHLVGDLLQDRQRIHTLAYQMVFEVMEKYSGKMPLKILLGNHDLWFAERWDVSSVTPLRALPNVHLIDKPCSIEIGGRWFDWLPFVKNPIAAVDKYFGSDRSDRVLYAHIAVDGAKQGHFGHTSDVSVEFESDMVKVAPSAFDGWPKVLMGHYHLAQFLDERMQYVGSPYQINFCEVGHVPQLVILDTEYMTVEYVENTFSPRHLIVNESELGSVDMVNNFVQVRGDLTKFDAFEIKRCLADEKARSIQFRASDLRGEVGDVSEVRKRFNMSEGKTFERYIDAVGTNGLDRADLIGTALEVVDESSEE